MDYVDFIYVGPFFLPPSTRFHVLNEEKTAEKTPSHAACILYGLGLYCVKL